MRVTLNIIICLFVGLTMQAQSPIGAWESISTNEAGQKIRWVVVFSENYQVATHYNSDTGEFIDTNGGSWSIKGKQMTEIVEFDSRLPERVGSSVSFDVNLSETEMSIVGHNVTLTRIDDGSPGKLAGAWLMSGRKRNGEIQTRSTDGPRKTMKILSGTRFQWIAYNTETKQFLGTGGGTYSTENGSYVESIEFFSKDSSRVGAKLDFKFKLIDGQWHHSGLSSKGNPIYEIWSLRN
jgi:hypothetical protein